MSFFEISGPQTQYKLKSRNMMKGFKMKFEMCLV